MSITERPVSIALKNMLENNEPFKYAHLIKFERPSRPDSTSGLVSTSKQRYTYLTDASMNVSFDDGSTDLQGTANGTQVYLANKVLSVGAVSEQTKATAATTNIILDGNAIGASTQSTVTIVSGGTDLWDITWPATIDILSEGFREGDKVTLYNSQGTTLQTDDVSLGTFNIVNFRANNVLRVSKIDTTLSIAITNLRMDLASEEIISILLDKNAAEYASFINREVYIYRAYFQDGVMKGTPVPMFKGIIYNVGFEDSENAIKVTWGLTSHWGDFAQVHGRITSDEFHRALNESGVPQPLSAVKPIYAYDKGFAHSETSINLLATYVVQVEKQKVKYNKGFFGIGSKMKVTKYLEPENRNTNLDFQLNAKNIPLIYGVRSAEGINVFTDTLDNDSSTVYIATALCEGEIGGIYDVYIEGSSLICNDGADYDARANQTTANTVGLICRGRADRGDVLGGTNSIDKISPKIDFFGNTIGRGSLIDFNYLSEFNSDNYTEPTTAPASPSYSGVLGGESIKLTSPQDIVIDVFSGKSGQKASTALTEIAYAKNFKIQNSYWTGKDTVEYWGPNHRLIDTAYVVTKFKIADGETTIPQLEYIVRGKVLDCYNYDYSYIHDVKSSSESHTNFVLGQTVDLYNSSDVLINSSVQIVDKWIFKNPDGTDNVRFIFSIPPSLGYINGVPSVTKFYMKSGVNTWTMVTYNYTYLTTTVADAISSQITTIDNASTYIRFNYASNSFMTIEGDTTKDSPGFQITTSTFDTVTTGNLFQGAIMEGAVTATTFTSKYLYADYGTEAVTFQNSTFRLVSRNTIRLVAGSAVTDYYIGGLIQVTKYNAITGRSSVQEADIIGYDATNKIVTIDGIWSFIPEAGHTVKIYPKYVDSRVSINPAIQSLDYITSKTYGKGLDYAKDLDLPSWLETARKCDTRSDVTVKTISGALPSAGAIYKYPATGNIIWQGTVLGTSGLYVEFTSVLGKLTNKWNAWKSWAVDEVIYNPDTGQLFKVTSAGVQNTAPTASTGSLTLLASIALTKVSGTGGASLSLIATENPVQGLRSGSKISGYSLYDCDDINYFKLTGWDEHSQRYVTKHQCNLTIDTSAPLFDNMNTLLEHYNGILRYTAGKYYLDMEDEEPTIFSNDIRNITTDDIIGKIQLTDEGVRSAYNSLTAAFADPANKFEARSISFFNSDYLKIDRNVSKKGNLSVPGITNYYNTRLLADSFLNKSRYGLTINMTLRYHGLLLLAGTVIQVSYPRYNWVNKKFRIESINYQADGLVDVVAKEYDASFYTLSNIRKAAGTGATSTPNLTAIGGPTNLQVSSADTLDELLNGVQLNWTNDPNANPENVQTEIYGGQSPNFYIYISSITGNVATTTAAHGLAVGMNIYPTVTGNGFSNASTYYVLTTPTPTTFTVSTTTNIVAPATAPATANLTNGTGLNLKIQTPTLLATVPIPISFHIDNVVNAGSNRVEKYYWVRHKVTRS